MIGFWFQPFSIKALSIFRLILGSTLFSMYWDRHKDVELYFTNQGLVTNEMALNILPEYMRPLWLWSFWPDSWASTVHGFLLVGLLLVTFGVGGRLVTLLTWILNVAFIQRNYAVNFGADIIGNIWLFYLIFAGSGSWFTLKHFMRGWAYRPEDEASSLVSRVGVGLIKIHLCIIYFYTGVEKLKGSSWWEGTALWTVLNNSQMVVANFEWVKHMALPLVLLTWVTVLFEIFFWPMVFSKKYQTGVLLFGIAFHFTIGISMALMPFALIMIAPYALFIMKPK